MQTLQTQQKFTDYNLISLGDHCAIPEILRDLGLRKNSYPFDWIAKTNMLHSTNLQYNLEIIKILLKSQGDAKCVRQFLIGDCLKKVGDINRVNHQIWFPHETGSEQEIFTKYERRFHRLYEDIVNTEKKHIFFMLTRNIYITESEMDDFIQVLFQFQPENKIVFISGKAHDYLLQEKYRDRVIFQYIYYDTSLYWDYDYSGFRPEIKQFISKLFF